jgi:hypothetical protein
MAVNPFGDFNSFVMNKSGHLYPADTFWELKFGDENDSQMSSISCDSLKQHVRMMISSTPWVLKSAATSTTREIGEIPDEIFIKLDDQSNVECLCGSQICGNPVNRNIINENEDDDRNDSELRRDNFITSIMEGLAIRNVPVGKLLKYSRFILRRQAEKGVRDIKEPSVMKKFRPSYFLPCLT